MLVRVVLIQVTQKARPDVVRATGVVVDGRMNTKRFPGPGKVEELVDILCKRIT